MREESLVAGLRGGRLTSQAATTASPTVPMEFTPVHSPLWQGVVARPRRRRVRSVNVVSNAPCATVKTLAEAYFEAWKDDNGAPPPLVGMQRHVVAADTDAEAMSSARCVPAAVREPAAWRQFGCPCPSRIRSTARSSATRPSSARRPPRAR